jgi:ligand-binding sensor domain-containing protein
VYGEDDSLGPSAYPLYEDRMGNLWVAATTGLWRWTPGPPRRYPVPDTPFSMVQDGNGALLIDARGGIKQFIDGKAETYPLPRPVPPFVPRCLFRDRNDGLWIGTLDRGLLHVHQGRTDAFARADGLSGDLIFNLFEDREGNIWVATVNGLDRFRDFAVPTIFVDQGLSNSHVTTALATKDGSVWLGTSDGLNRWTGGQITIYRRRNGLPDDATNSIFQDLSQRP